MGFGSGFTAIAVNSEEEGSEFTARGISATAVAAVECASVVTGSSVAEAAGVVSESGVEETGSAAAGAAAPKDSGKAEPADEDALLEMMPSWSRSSWVRKREPIQRKT